MAHHQEIPTVRGLKQWLSKYESGTAASACTGNLLEMHVLSPTPDLPN